jgi:hypothetical protein
MKKRALVLGLLLAACVMPVLADELTPGAPPGWVFGGDAGKYEVGTEALSDNPGRQVAYIKSGSDATCANYSALFQTIRADAYRGKKVRLSARMRAVGPKYVWGTDPAPTGFDLFLVSQEPAASSPVYRGARNTWINSEWQNFSAVMKVPADATQISFGFRLVGPRAVGWIDAVRFEVVDDAIPDTRGPERRRAALERDYNMFRRVNCPARRGLVGKDERMLLAQKPHEVSRNIVLALSR